MSGGKGARSQGNGGGWGENRSAYESLPSTGAHLGYVTNSLAFDESLGALVKALSAIVESNSGSGEWVRCGGDNGWDVLGRGDAAGHGGDGAACGVDELGGWAGGLDEWPDVHSHGRSKSSTHLRGWLRHKSAFNKAAGQKSFGDGADLASGGGLLG